MINYHYLDELYRLFIIAIIVINTEKIRHQNFDI